MFVFIRHGRSQGMTYQAIADEAGVGVATAFRATKDVEFFQMEKLTGKDGKEYPPAYTRKQEPEAQIEPGPMPTGASP